MGLAILPNYVGQFLKKLTIEKLVCFLLSYFSFISMAYSISVPFSIDTNQPPLSTNPT